MDNEADKDHDVCKRPTNRSAADKVNLCLQSLTLAHLSI